MVFHMCLSKQTDLETDEWVSWSFLFFYPLIRIGLRSASKFSPMKELTLITSLWTICIAILKIKT